MSVGRKRNSCFIFQQVQRRSQTERARETTDRHARTHTETERETGRQRERVKETTPSRSTFIHPFTRTHSRNSKKNSTWFDNAIPQPSTAARGQQVHDGNTSLFAARYWAKKYHPHTSRHPWLPRSRHRAPGSCPWSPIWLKLNASAHKATTTTTTAAAAAAYRDLAEQPINIVHVPVLAVYPPQRSWAASHCYKEGAHRCCISSFGRAAANVP